MQWISKSRLPTRAAAHLLRRASTRKQPQKKNTEELFQDVQLNGNEELESNDPPCLPASESASVTDILEPGPSLVTKRLDSSDLVDLSLSENDTSSINSLCDNCDTSYWQGLARAEGEPETKKVSESDNKTPRTPCRDEKATTSTRNIPLNMPRDSKLQPTSPSLPEDQTVLTNHNLLPLFPDFNASKDRRILDLTCRETELLALNANTRRLLTARTLLLLRQFIYLKSVSASLPFPSEINMQSILQTPLDISVDDAISQALDESAMLVQKPPCVAILHYLQRRLDQKERAELDLFRDILHAKQDNENLLFMVKTLQQQQQLNKDMKAAVSQLEKAAESNIVESLKIEVASLRRQLEAKAAHCSALEDEIIFYKSALTSRFSLPASDRNTLPISTISPDSNGLRSVPVTRKPELPLCILSNHNKDVAISKDKRVVLTEQRERDATYLSNSAALATEQNVHERMSWTSSSTTADGECLNSERDTQSVIHSKRCMKTQCITIAPEHCSEAVFPFKFSMRSLCPYHFTYVPVEQDVIDMQLADFINGRKNLIFFTRVKPGYYLFGRLLIYIDQGRNYLRVHHEKQRYSVRKFVHLYELPEFHALAPHFPQNVFPCRSQHPDPLLAFIADINRSDDRVPYISHNSVPPKQYLKQDYSEAEPLRVTC